MLAARVGKLAVSKAVVASGSWLLASPGIYFRPMTKLLLILVLFGPSDKAIGDRVSAQVAALGGKSVRVLAGPEAAKELDGRGVKDVDLITSPEIGESLTRKGDVVVIRLDHRKEGGDDVVETTTWARGHTERHVAITGNGGDAAEGAVRGVTSMVGPLLPDAADAQTEETRLSQLADVGEWEELLQLVAPYGPPPAKPKSPRRFYYEVLALVRLDRLVPASEAAARMRAAYPDHFLTEAATSLIPPSAAPPAQPQPAK
jgi:hypothetical protein